MEVKIQPRQTWRNRKVNMLATVKGLSPTGKYVIVHFDDCMCITPVDEFRKKYVLESAV